MGVVGVVLALAAVAAGQEPSFRPSVASTGAVAAITVGDTQLFQRGRLWSIIVVEDEWTSAEIQEGGSPMTLQKPDEESQVLVGTKEASLPRGKGLCSYKQTVTVGPGALLNVRYDMLFPKRAQWARPPAYEIRLPIEFLAGGGRAVGVAADGTQETLALPSSTEPPTE